MNELSAIDKLVVRACYHKNWERRLERLLDMFWIASNIKDFREWMINTELLTPVFVKSEIINVKTALIIGSMWSEPFKKRLVDIIRNTKFTVWENLNVPKPKWWNK